jgi:hypothetical protein
MARVFAAEVAQRVSVNLNTIAVGSGIFNAADAAAFLQSVSHQTLILSGSSVIADMDRVADCIFER